MRKLNVAVSELTSDHRLSGGFRDAIQYMGLHKTTISERVGHESQSHQKAYDR